MLWNSLLARGCPSVCALLAVVDKWRLTWPSSCTSLGFRCLRHPTGKEVCQNVCLPLSPVQWRQQPVQRLTFTGLSVSQLWQWCSTKLKKTLAQLHVRRSPLLACASAHCSRRKRTNMQVAGTTLPSQIVKHASVLFVCEDCIDKFKVDWRATAVLGLGITGPHPKPQSLADRGHLCPCTCCSA